MSLCKNANFPTVFHHFWAAGWALDISDTTALAKMVTEVVEKFGGLDILINNAGISKMAPIDHEDYDAAWARTFEVNLTAQVRLIRLALPHLLASGAGRIVNIASTEGAWQSRVQWSMWLLCISSRANFCWMYPSSLVALAEHKVAKESPRYSARRSTT